MSEPIQDRQCQVSQFAVFTGNTVPNSSSCSYMALKLVHSMVHSGTATLYSNVVETLQPYQNHSLNRVPQTDKLN